MNNSGEKRLLNNIRQFREKVTRSESNENFLNKTEQLVPENQENQENFEDQEEEVEEEMEVDKSPEADR